MKPETITLHRIRNGQLMSNVSDYVAKEEPMELRVEGRSIAVLMRTPGHDEELSAGFLVSEGVVSKAAEIFEISSCPGRNQQLEDGAVSDVLLTKGATVDLDSLTRHVFSASSCGICGKAVLEQVFLRFPPLPEPKSNEWTIPAERLASLPDRLMESQETFHRTGGLHAAALFRRDGTLEVLREDVGRHNALDKLLGWALLGGRLPLSEHLLFVSGRVSFELMQKALAAGVPLVAAVSAPSSLAVEFALSSGQTLVGFVRNGGMNVYANPGRLTWNENQGSLPPL